MHPRAEEFRSIAAERFGLEVEIRELPADATTAADAADALGTGVENIVKSVVMMVDGSPVVVLTAGDDRVSEADLAAAMDAETARTATPEEVTDATGWSIGGVPPFGYETDVPRVIDPDLLERDRVWAGAGTPEAVFQIDPERLRTACDAQPLDVFE